MLPFHQPALVAFSLVAASPGISLTALWIYICASLLFIVGVLKITKELPQENGIDKVMPFGRLFFAIPMAVFASEHFTLTAELATFVPSWIPVHTFWVYLVGLGFFCGALAITVGVQARLAAALIGMTFLIFVVIMDIPAALSDPHNRFAWALALRELAFSGGAFAISLTSARAIQPSRDTTLWAVFPRVFIGIASLFYGVEHFLHPQNVPGIPLSKLTPEWIPGRIALSYFVGLILLLAGACLLLNKKTRLAATVLGLTILLTMVWVYLPILIAAPKDVVALNYFFDTLLFCGTILSLANMLANGTSVPRVQANRGAA